MPSTPVTDAERLNLTHGDVHSVKGLSHAFGPAALGSHNPAQTGVPFRVNG